MPRETEFSRLVTAVFRAWKQDGITFLVLRNHEDLPYATTNDIDVLVEPSQLRQAELALVKAARQAGFGLHNRAEFATLALYLSKARPKTVGDEVTCLCSPPKGPIDERLVTSSPTVDIGLGQALSGKGSVSQVHFDLFVALKWRGFEFLSASELLRGRIDRGLLAVPHPAHQAACNLLASMIYTGRVKPKYQASILSGFRAAPDTARALLGPIYGERHADLIVDASSVGDWPRIERLTGTLRRMLVWRQSACHPLKTANSLFSDTVRLARRWLHPPGLAVVLCGADGSGKSTAAPAVVDGLSTTFSPEKGAHFHWKPPVFSARRQTA